MFDKAMSARLTVTINVAVSARSSDLAPVLVIDLENPPVIRSVLVLGTFSSRVV